MPLICAGPTRGDAACLLRNAICWGALEAEQLFSTGPAGSG